MSGKKRQPRLQFTDSELTPKLKRHVRRAEKAADKAEAAQAKIPKTRKAVRRRMTDQHTGRLKKRLYFEEVDRKKPASLMHHALRDAPVQTAAGTLHREVHKAEQDNVGVESAHRLEQSAEGGLRLAEYSCRAHKLKPYHAAEKAERRLEKANVNALYQKHLHDSPQPASNPVSRWRQKQAIKKQYAASVRSGQSAAATARNTSRAAKKAAEKSKDTGQFLWRHRKGIGIILALAFLVTMLSGMVSSCSMMVQSGLGAMAGSSYPSQDGDMLGAEAAYAGMEADLQYELDHYESLHPDYDEYHYDLDSIGHDPYVLISTLTAYHQGEWTLTQVQGTMEMLFGQQYTLTEEVDVEVRYRTETRTGTTTSTDPVTGETTTEEYEYEVEVPYDYYICHVTLENFDLSHLPAYVLDEDQLGMYAAYMATLGNRPDLFPTGEYPNASTHEDYLDYDVPPEALEDEQFAAILREAEKYLGYPYVWGGSNPSTSFDCSGYVSWVINHSGWDVGRLTAQGLYGICTPVSAANARPGDLVFFKGTYDTPGISHVGIYVGNSMMIHCGSPISYASLNTSYWQAHLYTYGRLR